MMAKNDNNEPKQMNDRQHSHTNTTSSHGQRIKVSVIAAAYGPCEGLRLETGELTSDDAARIPLTRDVTPFVRALLIAASQREQRRTTVGRRDDADQKETTPTVIGTNESSLPHVGIELPDGGLFDNKTPRTFIHLLGAGKSMNSIFGDPCPGTSKRLNIHYLVTEQASTPEKGKAATKSETHFKSFPEHHERVELRRRLTFFQDDARLQQAIARATTAAPAGMEAHQEESDDETTLQVARKMGRSQSIQEFQEMLAQRDNQPVPENQTQWRLRSAVSEIALPHVLQFLNVKERVQCRVVCRSWKYVVRDWGVTTEIDSNNSMFTNFTRPFFRGLLSQSYVSLRSLFLGGFEQLEKEDFHPSIPHLRALRSLDISRCCKLDDSTLELLSKHVHRTLEVLYIKGLRNVTDKGVKAICESCGKVEILDVSNVAITDEGALTIQKLPKLRALFLRDNYLLSNESINAITTSCTEIRQLTLWGSIRLNNLSFSSPSKIIFLNLWGCHSLRDGCAKALGELTQLKSLVVSECHRFTDKFLIYLCQGSPKLNHLHMRYCKRITDTGLETVALNMNELYSLDLSFCNRITPSSLHDLLRARRDSLAELRLKNCSQLQIVSVGGSEEREVANCGSLILDVLRSFPKCALSVIDLRDCGSNNRTSEVPYPETDPFVVGVKELGFAQKIQGYFSRAARWDTQIQGRLVKQVMEA